MRPWVDTDLFFWHRIGVSQTFSKYKNPNLLNSTTACPFFTTYVMVSLLMFLLVVWMELGRSFQASSQTFVLPTSLRYT
jgi:hypothetical protein